MPEEKSTQLVKPLHDTSPSIVAARNEIKSMIEDGRMNERGRYKNTPWYRTAPGKNGYVALYDDVTEQVLYFVKFRTVPNVKGIEAGRQVLLWRAKNKFAESGFAREVFWKVLLPQFKVLFADTEQTALGKSFWETAIDHALSASKFVYCYDGRTAAKKLIPLLTQEDVSKYERVMWGTSDSHLNTFPVISLHELKI